MSKGDLDHMSMAGVMKRELRDIEDAVIEKAMYFLSKDYNTRKTVEF